MRSHLVPDASKEAQLMTENRDRKIENVRHLLCSIFKPDQIGRDYTEDCIITFSVSIKYPNPDVSYSIGKCNRLDDLNTAGFRCQSAEGVPGISVSRVNQLKIILITPCDHIEPPTKSDLLIAR